MYIPHFLVVSFSATSAFKPTFFGDSDCMITSTFCILHMRVRARCLHSASTANSWKRRPTSIYIQCTESEQNSSGCIYIQHFGTPKHTPGFDLKTSDHFFLLIFIFLGFIFWSVRPSDRSEGFRLKKY